MAATAADPRWRLYRRASTNTADLAQVSQRHVRQVIQHLTAKRGSYFGDDQLDDLAQQPHLLIGGHPLHAKTICPTEYVELC